MTTLYPGQIPTINQTENEETHAALVTLGINPQGSAATVAQRFQLLEARVTARKAFFMDDYLSPQAAIDAAAAAGGGYVYAPWAVTTLTLDPVTHCFLTVPDTVSLDGFGVGKSVLKVPDGAGNYKAIIANSGALNHCTISNLTLDGNQAGNAPVDINAFDPIVENSEIVGFNLPRCAVYVNSGTHLAVIGVQVIGLDSINHVYNRTDHSLVSGCDFEQVTTFQHDHSTVYSQAHGHQVLYNRFQGTGVWARTAIETNGDDQQVIGNTITNYYKGFNVGGFSLDAHGTRGITVMQNHTFDCGGGVQIYSRAYGPTPDNQQVSEVLIAFNTFGMNKTLWPEASIDRAVYYADGNNKPVVNQLIGPNLVSV